MENQKTSNKLKKQKANVVYLQVLIDRQLMNEIDAKLMNLKKNRREFINDLLTNYIRDNN